MIFAIFMPIAWVFWGHKAYASTGDNWYDPPAIAVQRIGDLPGDAFEGRVFDNYDCTKISYRQTNRAGMSTGCFFDSDIGLVQEGGSSVIFNGTDEALPLVPYTANQLLTTWPGSGELVSLSHVATGGMRLGIYSHPLASLQDNRVLGILASKSITTPPLSVGDPLGNALDINPKTLTFSLGGDWMVAETMNGSFVRISRDDLAMLPFAPSFSTINSDTLLPTYLSISDDGRFVAMYNQYFTEFRVYDLSTCDGKSTSHLGLPPQNCAFYDYLPAIRERMPGLGVIRHVRFLNTGLIEFQVVTTSNEGKVGVYEMAPSSKIGSSINYLALGDSYTSGEGAFDYINGTDINTNKCHLSVWSYPIEISELLGGHSVACSGAVIKDIASSARTYKGQAREVMPKDTVLASYLPGYIPQHTFVAHYQPSITSVSIGGNDIGFGEMIERCVILHLGSNTCYSSYEERLEVINLINRTGQRLASLYKQLQREAPSTQLYVVGYPQVANKNGNCALNVHLDKSELEFTEQIITYLNSTIQDAAAQADAVYVDISQALNGHRLCEGSKVAVNGLTAGGEVGPLGRESYHPNAIGQRLITGAILAQTHSFGQHEIATATQPDSSQILQAPRSGRPISNISLTTTLTNPSLESGSRAGIRLDGAALGLKPNCVYRIDLDGMTTLTVMSDDNARISGDLQIPGTMKPGGHLLELLGEDEAGGSADISQLIYVTPPDVNTSQNISVKIERLLVSG